MPHDGGDAIDARGEVGEFASTGLEETRPLEKVFGRVAGEGQLGKGDERGTEPVARLGGQRFDALRILRGGADGEIELGQGEAERGHAGAMGRDGDWP